MRTTPTRREFVTHSTAVAVVGVAGLTTLGQDDSDPRMGRRRRSPGPRMAGNERRWTALEEYQSGPFSLGVADGTVTFIRSTSSWQNGQLIVFQMHGNGNSYRHNGHTFETLSSGNWVHGPDLAGYHYSGIASVMQRDGKLYAFTHDEHYDSAGNNASVGVLESDLDGYVWTRIGHDVVPGQQPQPDGFRGSSIPCVVEVGNGSLSMFYTNRFGNGRHNEVWWATAAHPAGPWTVHGAAITESGTHYFAEGVTVVWSDENDKWLMIYSTDKATRFSFSDDLVNWTTPKTFLSKASQWQQTSGFRRWYGALIDETQNSSARIGARPVLSEHWISTDHQTRFPILTDVSVRS
jgi:hypothetical protein